MGRIIRQVRAHLTEAEHGFPAVLLEWRLETCAGQLGPLRFAARLMKLRSLTLSALAGLMACTASLRAGDADGWISMFNGKDLTGWKSNDEVPNVFTVENGELKVSGGRSHLFYVGDDGKATFKNFILKAKVKTTPGSNSGLYFHTAFQATGWPDKGFECQVNSTHKDPKKTGSLYGVINILALAEGQKEPEGGQHIKVPAAPSVDGEWFDYEISVKGKQITLSVNGKVTVEFTEPEGWDPAKELKNMPGRKLSEGTFAIQGHDPMSTTYYKDIMVKPLP
jgi:hypothetical protein